MKLQAGQLIAGRYKIDHVLGSGGMAVVYRALDTKLDRYVALKILREELAADEEFARRFPIEAMAAAALSHPNIVSIYDYGQDQDVYYIVLEYVGGSNLKDLIHHHAPFDNEATLGMALQIADGLAAAHRAEIIHRDIKPQNILVTTNSNAKVADFGIARVVKSGTITASESMGSAQYFSPEQARGGYVDHKTDIYSLGITMYEMATGQLPFDGDNVVTVALKHINDPLPDMMEINPKISESVRRIILKATEKSPAKRYQDIEEMAEDLNQALTDASGSFVLPLEDTYQGQHGKPAPQQGRQGYDDDYDDFYDDVDFDEYDTNQPPPRDKKSDRTVILVGIGVGLIFALLILLGSCSVYNRFRTVRLSPPDITGMTYEEALHAAQEAGLGINVLDYAFHNEVPEGRIISQNPTHANANMAPGSDIQITISLGPSQYTMPDLIGMNEDAAIALLEELQVSFLILDGKDDAEIGTVFRQIPDAGEPVGEGTPVFIYVSRDTDEYPEDDYVLMPSLIGSTLAAAQVLLEEASLVVDEVLHDESTTFAAGMIFSQNPMPGAVVERGTTVRITVSTGSPLPPTPTPTPEPEENDDPDAPYSDPDDPYSGQYDPNDPYGGPSGDPNDPYDPGEDQDPGGPGQGDTDYPPVDPPPPPVSRNLTIALWDVPTDTEQVHIRVTRQPIGGALTTEANTPMAVTAFPLDMHIQGNGIVIYRVYTVVDGVAHFIRAYEINFDE